MSNGTPNTKFVFTLVLCLPLILHAQKLTQLDSLVQNAQTYYKQDTLKVILLKNIALKYAEINPDKGIEYADKAIALAQMLGVKKYIAQSYHSKGYNYQVTGDAKEAMRYYELCLKLNEQLNDKIGVAFALHEIGTIFLEQLHIWEAMDYLKKSLAISMKAGDIRGAANCYTDLAGCAYQQGDYPLTLDYLFKGIPLYTKLKDQGNVANNNYNIGMVYKNVKDYAKAIEYYQKALAIHDEMGYKRLIALVLVEIGDSYTLLADFTNATRSYIKAIEVSRDINDKKLQSLVLVGMAQNEMAQNNPTEAIVHLQKSLALRKEIGYINGIIVCYKLLGTAAIKQNNYSRAIEQLRLAKQITDTIVTSQTEKSEILTLLSVAYLNIDKYDSAYYYYVAADKLKDSASNDANLKELTKKELQYEFDKKADSLHFKNALIQSGLQQKALLAQQQLLLTSKEKELQRLTLLKTQADLKSEQLNVSDRERELALSEKEKRLKQESLETISKDIALQQMQLKQWRFYGIGGFVLLVVVAVFVYYRRNIKLQAEMLRQEQRQNKELSHHLQLEQITNFFTSSVASKNNTHDILWDVADNLVSKLELVDCMLYLWNDHKTKLIQIAGYGPKGSIAEIKKLSFEVVIGQGVVGYVAETKQPMLIPDTSVEPRYRVDEMQRLSELCVPMLYNNELVGIIDSEHYEKNFYTEKHLQIFKTLATLIASKIKSIEIEDNLQKKKLEAALLDQELTKMEIKALHTQMNPHFIFNCLGSIKQMILLNEQENANKYLSMFAKMIRQSLEHSRRTNITVREKLSYLSNYLEMERLRFDNSFNYKIEVDANLIPEETTVPPMMVQPLVENAIWHGLMNKEGDRQIFIRYKLQGHHLLCEVEDNGIGIHKNKRKENVTHKSLGIENIRRRIELLNQKYHTHCALSFIDKSEHSATETGTIAILTLPFSKQNVL